MSLDTVTEEKKETPDIHGVVTEDRETPDIHGIVTEDVKIENLLILNTIGTGAEYSIQHVKMNYNYA